MTQNQNQAPNSNVQEKTTLSDFPKVQCPFVRKLYKTDKDQWKQFGAPLKLKHPQVYLVTEKINPGFEWVFDDPDTIAVEKLDGTNIKILTKNGRLEKVQNRMNVIDPLLIIKGKFHLLEGIFNSIGKGYVELDGEQAGELIGPKLQGNPYELTTHEWYPFVKTIENLSYRSFLEHDRTFENLSNWFKDHLHSRLYTKKASKLGIDKKVFAEGVIFYNLKRKQAGLSYMAKLRRDMFDWYYSDKIQIFDYNTDGSTGRLPSEADDVSLVE
jgi:hypothetical protein